jgi:hypothetical protein
MYIPAGIKIFTRHGARDVSGVSSSGIGPVVPASSSATSSDPSQIQLPTSSKSLIGMCSVVGAFLFGSYTCTGTGPDDPPHAEGVSQPPSFVVSSTSVERLVLPGHRGLASLICMGLKKSRPSFPSRTQRMTAHLARAHCWIQHHLTPLLAGSLKSEVSLFAPVSRSLL